MRTTVLHPVHPHPAMGEIASRWLGASARYPRNAANAAGDGLVKITKARLLLERGTPREPRRL